MTASGVMDFVPMKEEIIASYEPDSTQDVTLHDGSVIHLHKLAEDIDPLDRGKALQAVENYRQKGEILTGLIYMNPDSRELHESLKTVQQPLNSLTETELCPGNKVLMNLNQSLR
jgi:2-oxoglutarate ferredoxin oxidoreductase subunit beta